MVGVRQLFSQLLAAFCDLGILTAMPQTPAQPVAPSNLTTEPTDAATIPETPDSTPETTTPFASNSTAPKRRIWLKVGAVVGVVLLFLLAIVGVVGAYTYTVVMELKGSAQEAATAGQNAYLNFKSQNLPASKEELKKLQQRLDEVEVVYQKLSFYQAVPIARNYYLDGVHGINAAEAGVRAGIKAVEAVEPHADLLGFSGEGTFEGGSAENRIKLILETLQQIVPIMDEIQSDLAVVGQELEYINPNRYPEEFRGMAVRSKLLEAKNVLSQTSEVFASYRPILEKLPEIAGSTGERKKYLILFQNDNELRATGGFLTAYAVVFMEDGVVTPEKSDDIYEVDKKMTQKVAIPEQLGRYLTTEKYWNLRDMNISPDFKISMEQFFENYSKIKGEPDNIDGIIAVDTHVLTDLIKVVGPIQVPGYGTFSAEIDPACDCPQIIHALSEIITRPTPYLREDRKGILAPLMQGILSKLYSSPRTYMAQLFEVGLKDVSGRHIQVYFFNPDHQAAAEAINAAGRMIAPTVEGSDFLAIINSNLGGAKSNLFIDYSVTQEISAPSNGRIQKNVEITYKNNRHGDNCNLEAGLLCLNSTNRDWTRLYVPLGTELVDAQGFNEAAQVYEENGFTVIEGFFFLEPNSQAKLRLSYTVPYTNPDTYTVKLWKQGGIDPVPMIMDVEGNQEEILLDQDTTYSVDF